MAIDQREGNRNRRKKTPSPCIQQAKFLELWALRSLARLWQRRGKKKEDHKMLAKVYDWFTEGFDTKDLQEARILLETLWGDIGEE